MKKEDKKKSDKKESNLKEVQLKLKKKHPSKKMRVLDIVVEGYQFKKYEVSEEVLKELESVGCKAWIEIKK